MTLARRRLASAFMMLVVVGQAATARPLSCVSDKSEHQGLHDHHTEIAVEDTDVDSAVGEAVVTSSGTSSHTTPTSESCVTTTHCDLNPVAFESPHLEVKLTNGAVEGPGPTWNVHAVPATHPTPPPKA